MAVPSGTSRFHSGSGLPHSKTWRLVAAFVTWVLTFVINAPASAAQSTVSLGTDGAAQGHSVELPLWLENRAQFAAVQMDLVFDPLFVNTNGMSITSALPDVLVDGGVVASNRYRVVMLSTNRVPLPSGEAARITFSARTNSPNGRLHVRLGKPSGVEAVSVTTNGACASGLNFQAGQFLVGDAFAFSNGVGRVQFRTVDGATNVIVASTAENPHLDTLATWLAIGTNVGVNELVIWMDQDVTRYSNRFYKVKAP